MKKINRYLWLLWLLWGASQLYGQATLSVQGTIQKASGANLDDGAYSMSFRFYTAASGGTPIWSETQDKVEVTGGVYGALLGSVTPLTIAFDRPYFLGVSVDGGAELAPRIRLTASPYSMSLVGQNNLFPSVGTVGIGTLQPDTSAQLHLQDTSGTGRMLVEGRDSAVIVFKTTANTATIKYDGDKLFISDLNLVLSGGVYLPAGQSVKYNNLPTWRLVEVDDFSTDAEGWSCTDNWASSTSANFERFSPETPFSNGFILRPVNEGNDALVKQFDLSGIPHTMVKVVFTYHFFDSWDAPYEFGYAGFGTRKAPLDGSNQNTGIWQVGWRHFEHWPNDTEYFNTIKGAGYANFFNGATDYNLRGEMVAQTSDDKFWIIFASNLDEAASNESYGISNVQIWVR
jgi:hypothetical protein